MARLRRRCCGGGGHHRRPRPAQGEMRVGDRRRRAVRAAPRAAAATRGKAFASGAASLATASAPRRPPSSRTPRRARRRKALRWGGPTEKWAHEWHTPRHILGGLSPRDHALPRANGNRGEPRSATAASGAASLTFVLRRTLCYHLRLKRMVGAHRGDEADTWQAAGAKVPPPCSHATPQVFARPTTNAAATADTCIPVGSCIRSYRPR